MNWEQLFAFLCAARAKSLQQAAAAAGVDRATVSRRIAALEATLKAPLFVRGRDGLSLTPTGERVLREVEAMEAAAGRATAFAPSKDIKGVVRLATTEALGPFLVEQGVLDVTAQYPALRLDLVTGNQRMELSREEADLAVRLDPIKGAALTVRPLARMGLGLFAADSYLKRRGGPRSPDELAGHEVLMMADELTRLPEAQWLAGQPGVVVAMASNSFPTLVAAANRGRGLVTLSLPWGEREGLKLLFTLPGIPQRTLYLVTTQLTRRRPAVAAVAAHLVDLFQRLGLAP